MADKSLCSIPDCDKKIHARGWCDKHYFRWSKHGDPLGGGTAPGKPWQYMLDHMHDDCPKWPYARDSNGRAVVAIAGSRNRKRRRVYQIVCEMAHGPRPTPAHEVTHNCGKGTEGCFGAGCLEWKTRAGNEKDKLLHGTSNRGGRHGMSKLSEADVIAIRRNESGISPSEMASAFGVTVGTVHAIINRKSWKWLVV